jgi:hypothetical protein
LAAVLLAASPVRADWQRTDTTVAWTAKGKVVWQFSFDPAKGKAFFHPVTVGGGPSLTNFKPVDHPWHYALWFSWKYINGVNYWEEDRQTGRANGKTSWASPQIATRADGSATIRLNVSYTHPTGRADLTEVRTLAVSAPDESGKYTIDWSADFTAGPEGAELARTPMPGEPGGQVNGGYAGLSVRLAAAPLAIAMVTTESAVKEFVKGRARPNSPAVGCNLSDAGRSVGAIALLSAPENIAPNSPWYLIDSNEMRFACAAVLAPQVRKLPPQGAWKMRYRIVVGPEAWTPASLREALASWGR